MASTGSVVINIVGDSSKFTNALSTASGSLDAFGRKTESTAAQVGVAFASIGVAVAAVGVGVTAALYGIGKTFDEQFDKIRVNTGATGYALGGLENDFKAVVSNVPTDFGKAGDAIAFLNQKLDLTGKPLQTLSEQFLLLSHLTGEDLTTNLKTVTDAFQSWGVRTEDQTTKLDLLFRAMQKSGLSVSDIAGQLSDVGLQLRALGFNFDEATALVATFGKAGVDVTEIAPALSRAIGTAAKDNVSLPKFFQDLFDQIKQAPSVDAAAAIAFDQLGLKTGPKFALLVREGRLSYEDMLTAIAGGSDTISQAEKDTADFNEKFTILKNRILVGLEPIATRVFTAFGRGLDRLPGLINEVKTAWEGFIGGFSGTGSFAELSGLGATFGDIGRSARGMADTVTAVWQDFLAEMQPVFDRVGLLVAYIEDHWAQIEQATQNLITLIELYFAPLVIFLKAVWDNIGEIIAGALQIIQGIIEVVLGILTLDFGTVWQGIQDIFGGAWDIIVGIVKTGLENVLGLAQFFLGVLLGVFSGAWDAIKGAVSGGIDAVISLVALLPQELVNVLGDLGPAFRSAGINAMQGLWDGLRSIAGGIKDWVSNFAGDMVKKLTDPLGIFSPSKKMAWVGEMMMSGLAKGIEGNADQPLGALGSTTGVINKIAAGNVGGAGGGGGSIVIENVVVLDGEVVARNTAKHLNRAGGPQLSPRAIAS